MSNDIVVSDARLASLMEQVSNAVREAYTYGFARGMDAGIAMEREGKVPALPVTDLLQDSIDVLKLSSRPHHALRRGLRTAAGDPSPLICQVLMYTPAKMMKEFYGLGQTSFNELYEKLVAHGIPMTQEWTAAYKPDYRA